MRHTYFERSGRPGFSHRVRYTFGEYALTTEPTGEFGFRYAVFRNRSSELLIPTHDLTAETKSFIANREAWKKRADELVAEYWPDGLPKRFERRYGKHLFLITPSGHGYFLIYGADGAGIHDREAFRAILAEAQALKLAMPVNVYCSIASYMGPNIEIIQIT